MPRALMQRVRLGGGPDGGTVVPLWVHQQFVLAGTTPATAANWGNPFFMPYEGSWELIAVRARLGTAGTDAGAVTCMLKQAPSGTALSAGTDMLASGLNLKTTANTSLAGTLHATTANIQLTGPDSAVGFVLTGTPTALAGVMIQTVWKKI
jgi:hypothetical protein